MNYNRVAISINYANPIRKSNLISVFKAQMNGESKIIKIVNPLLPAYENIKESIDMTLNVSQLLPNLIYPEYFLQQQKIDQENGMFVIVSAPYQYTLQQYLSKKVVRQPEAMVIFEQIVKCVYSFYSDDRWHRCLRPEHFVKVGDFWKLQSFVFEGPSGSNGSSEYQWLNSYQAPQCYSRKAGSQELDELIVWNLGSLLVDLILQGHRLSNIETLNKFKNREFSLSAIGVNLKVSDRFHKLLGSMLHYLPEKRMKYEDLFLNQFVSPELVKTNQQMQRLMKSPSLVQKISKETPKFGYDKPGKSFIISSISELDFEHSTMTKTQDAKRQQSRLSPKSRGNIRGTDLARISSVDNESAESRVFVEFTIPASLQEQSDLPNLPRIKILPPPINISSSQRPQNGFDLKSTFGIEGFRVILNSSDPISEEANLQPIMNKYNSRFEMCILLQKVHTKLDLAIKQGALEIDQKTVMPSRFAILFAATLTLQTFRCQLAKPYNLFRIPHQLWLQVINSKTYHKDLKVQVDFKVKEYLDQVRSLRRRIEIGKEIYLQKGNTFLEDLMRHNCGTSKFKDIKQTYRKIILSLLETAKKSYSETKRSDPARISFYLTFALTFDKIGNEKNMNKLLKPFLESGRLDRCDTIPYETFERYIENSDGNKLFEHSNEIFRECFQI